MKRIIVILAIFMCFSLCLKSATVDRQEAEVCKVEDSIKCDSNKLDVTKLELTKENLIQVMNYYGLHHQNVVMQQALLETGHFTSKLCRTGHNLFGLRGRKGYYRYSHWSESVKAYRDKIQRRYKSGENYYSFLVRIRYCESSGYVSKLKKIK